MDSEKDAWRDLVQSPGWAQLERHVRNEWEGAVFEQHVEQVLDKADADALSKGRQLIAAKRAALRVLAIPREQIAKLERTPSEGDPAYLGRRGPL